jgi:nuclear pore complex protein Nup188
MQKKVAQVIKDCLSANAMNDLPETIFKNIGIVRTDLALALTQRLAAIKSTDRDVCTILQVAWSAITGPSNDFLLALSGGESDTYRSLLKILFLVLRINVDRGRQEAAKPPISRDPKNTLEYVPPGPHLIFQIVDTIVARGFKDLVGAIHDSPDTSSPEDIALITGILSSCLRIPDISTHHKEIASVIAQHDTPRIAATLFSWSEQLAQHSNNDPVYGELSMLFLLELSSIPLIAEQMAVEGVLGLLAESSLIKQIRRRGIDAFEQPRLYAIWTRGVLPLLLNLLDAVGAAVAGEVSLFLYSFTLQLGRAVQNFDPDATHGITLGMAVEIRSLAALTRILGLLKSTSGIREVMDVSSKFDLAGLREKVGWWMVRRKALKGRIIVVGEEERDLERMIVSGGGEETILEQRVVTEMEGAGALCLDNN